MLSATLTGSRPRKGGRILHRAAFIAIFTLLTVIRTYYRIATGAFLPRLRRTPSRRAPRLHVAKAVEGR